MEKVIEVQPLMVFMECPECGTGLMEDKSGNTMLCSYPPKYPHKCTICGHTENYDRRYPYIDYIAVKGKRLRSRAEEEMNMDEIQMRYN